VTAAPAVIRPGEAGWTAWPGRRRALAVGASWLLPAGVAAQSAADYLTRPLSDRLADLHVYVLAIRALVHGQSLYALHPGEAARFTYPPFAGIVFVPIAPLPEPVTRVLWTILTFALVVVLTGIAVRHLPRRLGPAEFVWPVLTALVLASKPVQSNLRFGQVSLLLVLAVLADTVSLYGRRAQGVLTGLAAAIKLTPLVFVPFLWLTGRRRAAGVATGCFLAATALGWAVAPADSRAYWFHNLVHEAGGLPLSSTGNQSLYAVALRQGIHGHALAAGWAVVSVLVGLLGLWRARRAWAAGQPLLAVAIAGCVDILVSPISWTHHQLWIVLGAAGVFTASGPLDAAIAAAILVPMVIGLPGVALLGAPGRWLADNDRMLLAAAIATALPIRSLRSGAGSPEPPPAPRRHSAGRPAAPR
jgi:alpha-1,2-mannosyltransferase